jgi:hypothetical protein
LGGAGSLFISCCCPSSLPSEMYGEKLKRCCFLEWLFVASTRVARFLLTQHSKTGKYIPNDYLKNTANTRKIFQMAVKYTNGRKILEISRLYIAGTSKYTQIGILGIQIHHLATPVSTCYAKSFYKYAIKLSTLMRHLLVWQLCNCIKLGNSI